MLNRAVVIVLLISPLLCQGQQSDLLDNFLATSPVQSSTARVKLNDHISRLYAKRSQKELSFLHKIFWATQKRFLKTYTPYEPFGELFESGKYDCLTATSLYSILLNEFNFDYSIVETNYHIFILVNTRQGEVLLETTDRYDGFVQDKAEIEKRIGTYRQNSVASSNVKSNYYLYSFDLYKKINSAQIAGLLHFNQAVKAFNNQDWRASAEQLDIARRTYDSQRIKELATLLIQSVPVEETDLRKDIIQRFKDYWMQDQQTIAAKR